MAKLPTQNAVIDRYKIGTGSRNDAFSIQDSSGATALGLDYEGNFFGYNYRPTTSGDAINVNDYGAFSSGYTAEIITTVGTAATLVSGSVAVNDKIMIPGAGPNGTDLWTRITAVNGSALTLANAASGIVDAISYGNVNDVTTQIQAAIDAASELSTASNQPVNVYIPAGLYIYSAPFVANIGNGCGVIFGDAPGSTILIAQNPAIATPQGCLNFCGSGLRDLTIVGNRLGSVATPTAGAEVSLFAENEVSNVEVISTPFKNGLNISFQYGGLTGCYDAGQTAISNATMGYVEGCTAAHGFVGDFFTYSSCYAAPGGWANDVAFEGAASNFVNCLVQGQGSGFSIGFTGGRNIYCENCYADGGSQFAGTPCGTGFLVPLASTLINCTGGATTTGFEFLGTSGVDLTDPGNIALYNCSALVNGGGVGFLLPHTTGSPTPFACQITLDSCYSFINGSTGKHVYSNSFAGLANSSVLLTGGWVIQDSGITTQIVSDPTNPGLILIDVPIFSDVSGAPIIPTVSGNVQTTGIALKASGTTSTVSIPLQFEGSYRVDYYIEVDTAGSGGTLTPSVTYTDGIGSNTESGTAINLNGQNRGSGSFYINNTDNSTTFNLTTATVSGSPSWNARVSISQI